MTTQEFDELIEKLVKARENTSNAKREYEDIKAISDDLEDQVIQALEAAGKTTYIAEGAAKVTLSYIMAVQTPKTPEDKLAFFDWLKKHKGEDVATAYLSVNSQALNSLYNELEEEWNRRGEILQIDGLDAPLTRTKLSVRKA